jgi:hypothetical protein
MHRSLAFFASSLLTVSLAAWAGCKGGSSTTGTAGQTTTTTTTTTGDAGFGGGSTCAGPGPDGVCNLSMGEDCNCVDCLATAYCNPGQCLHTDKCDHLDDSCTCPGCAEDAYCGDPYLGNCKDGGACDPFVEGCHCPNCWAYSACQASVAACAGGKPDGVCDRTKENCTCVDCQGTPLCVPCMNGGACTAGEPCYCPDCIHDMLCNDPSYCVDNGVCAAHIEGCECNDCKDLPECAYRFDGGADGATDGATGDAGTDAAENDAASDAGLDAADAGG